MKLIPFWLYALNKNYSGKEYDIEKVKYYYSGKEQELKILSIMYAPNTFEYDYGSLKIGKEYDNISEVDYNLEKGKLFLRYDKISNDEFKLIEAQHERDLNIISPFTYEIKEAELTIKNEKERNLKINEIEFMYGIKSKYDYEISKINITYPSTKTKDYMLSILSKKKEFNKISEYEYDRELNNLTYDKDTSEWKLENLKIEKKYNKISEHQFEKEECNIKHEPYFSIISEKYVDSKIEFELDWNDIFIQKLKESGMEGYTEQQMVDLYFKEICKQIAEEEDIFDYREQFGPSIQKEQYDDSSSFYH